jgi:hypothetical protein
VIPFTAQRTLESLDLVTDAVNCAVWPNSTDTVGGEIETATPGVIVAAADVLLVESAWLVADTVTVAGLGIVEGAA